MVLFQISTYDIQALVFDIEWVIIGKTLPVLREDFFAIYSR